MLYLLYGTQRHVTDSATLAALGFVEHDARPVSQRGLEAIPQGAPVPNLSNGSFIAGPDGNRYLLLNGAHRIPDDTTFDANGWNGLGNFAAVPVVEIDWELLNALPRRAAIAPAERVSASRFDWGNCTWWVASRRSVPWLGNAVEWYGNAQTMGYAVGDVPVPGAILVRRSAVWTGYGHVAYVESVDGTTFTVSEMNVNGLGELTTRTYDTVSDPPPGLLGYVYWRYGDEPDSSTSDEAEAHIAPDPHGGYPYGFTR